MTKSKHEGTEEEALFSVPFGVASETVAHPRYCWDSASRGTNVFVIFQYTLAGTGVFEFGGKRYEVPEGHAFIAITPERSRYYYPPDYPPEGREPWTFCWLNFYNRISVDAWRALRSRFGPVIELPRASAAGMNVVRLARLVKDRRLVDRFEASEEAYGLTMSCWRHLAQRADSGAGAVEAAAQYCREHYRDAISVKELADQSGLTREHFTRLFGAAAKQNGKMSAEELLARHALPLKEVAMRCGFYSTRQFVNAYRKAKGTQPRSTG